MAATDSIEERLQPIRRRLAEMEDALRTLRVAAAGAAVFLREHGAQLPDSVGEQRAEVLAELTDALRRSSTWPFPVDPAMQAAKAREHRAQQRAAIVGGPEALL